MILAIYTIKHRSGLHGPDALTMYCALTKGLDFRVPEPREMNQNMTLDKGEWIDMGVLSSDT